MVIGFNSQWQQKNTNILDVKVEDYTDCGFCKSREQLKIYVPWKIWSEWRWIMQKMGNKEWGAVYDVKQQKVARDEEKKTVQMGAVVMEYRIPRQTVSSGETEFNEDLGGNGIVHSHHSMGAFHSAQDDKQSRNLYEWSIVLANDAIECTKREKLPCGGFGYLKATVYLLGCPDIDLSRITEKTYVGYTASSTPTVADTKADDEAKKEVTGQFPFSQYDPDTGSLREDEEKVCAKCGGTGVSSANTVCGACDGMGIAETGDENAEVQQEDYAVDFRCNVCHKFFGETGFAGDCPHCASKNWRTVTKKELKLIAKGAVCKKCPSNNCAGCLINIAEMNDIS